MSTSFYEVSIPVKLTYNFTGPSGMSHEDVKRYILQERLLCQLEIPRVIYDAMIEAIDKAAFGLDGETSFFDPRNSGCQEDVPGYFRQQFNQQRDRQRLGQTDESIEPSGLGAELII